LFQRSLAWAREDGIRLRLRLDDKLSAWPWEYLYIQDARGEQTPSGFLALDPRISIVRHEALAQRPTDWFAPESDRRVIVSMASPKTYPTLESLPREQAAIRDALDKIAGIRVDYLPRYPNGDVTTIPGARVEDLTQALAERTDILHFSGHGEFVKGPGPGGASIVGEGAIVLAGADNQAVPYPAYMLADLLRSRGVRLVVLGACETGQRDSFHVWSSVAASLIKAGVPAVVAMQFSINDKLAAAFMGAFYRALVAGELLDNAMSAGRAAIRAEALSLEESEIRDWGVPVLYLRSAGARVFNPVTDKEALELAVKGTADLVKQQLGTIRSGGRVLGNVSRDVKGISVDVKQNMLDVEAGAVVIGSYAVRYEGNRTVIEQVAGDVSGTLIGSVMNGGQGDWLGIENWLQSEFKPQTETKQPSTDASPKFCSQCGEKLGADAKFCMNCGARIAQ
jgi:hypothetical protein